MDESGAGDGARGKDPELALPAELTRRYRAERLLGRGAMGKVVAATDTELRRRVAIKLMLAPRDPGVHKRFLREAQLLCRVEHPNVLRLFEAGDTPEGPFLVTELLEGMGLDEAGPSLGPEAAIEAMRQVALGLQAIHDQGLLHRDLKPANLFRTREGRTLILDLGLATDREATRITGTGAVVGTLLFLAPEVLEGKPQTTASDWYAWGVTLFWLLEGRPPFEAHELMVTRHPALRGPQGSHPRLDGSPAGAVVRACLDADPSRRPGNASEVLSALASAPQCDEVSHDVETAITWKVSPIGPGVEPGRGPVARSRSAGGPVLVAVLAIGLALATGSRREPPMAGSGATRAAQGESPPSSPATPGDPPSSGSDPGDRGHEVRDGGPGPGLPRLLLEELAGAEGRWVDAEGRIPPTERPGPGARELLDPDPARFAATLAHLPRLAGVYRWLAGGGRAESLDPGLVKALPVVDERYAGLGLFRPLGPFLDARPVPECAFPGLPGGFWNDDLVIPARVKGWTAAALASLADLIRQAEVLTRGLKEDPRGIALLEQTQLGPFFLERGENTLNGVVTLAHGKLALRLEASDWLRSGTEGYLRMVCELARAVRDEPETGELGLWLVMALDNRISGLRFHPATALDPGILFGPGTGTLADRVLRAWWAKERRSIMRAWSAERPETDLELAGYWRAALETSARTPAGAHLEGSAWVNLALCLADADDRAGLHQVWSLGRDRWSRLHPMHSARLLEITVRQLSRAGSPDPFSRADLEAIRLRLQGREYQPEPLFPRIPQTIARLDELLLR